MHLLCDGALDKLTIAPVLDFPDDELEFDEDEIKLREETPTFLVGSIWMDLELNDLAGLDWLGYFIGKSNTLRELVLITRDVDGYSRYSTSKPVCRLMQGINCNKSIQKLHIEHDKNLIVPTKLTPFLRNNALTEFAVGGEAFHDIEDARQIALAVTHGGKNSSLKNFSVVWDKTPHPHQVEFQELTAIINASPQLEKLVVRHLIDITHFDPGLGAHALMSGIANLHNLKTIWFRKAINDFLIHALAPGLPHMRMLTDLNLSRNLITDVGIQMLAPSLSNCHVLKDLNLSFNSLSDRGIQALVPNLLNCRMLTAFDVSENLWMDDGMEALASNLSNCHNLTSLGISQLTCTAFGIRSLRAIFQSTTCCLSELTVSVTNDSMIEKLVWGLEGNKSLKYLYFNHLPACSSQGWTPFSKLLCNKSSISETYSSNHTLEAFTLISIGDLEECYFGLSDIDNSSSSGYYDLFVNVRGNYVGVDDIRKLLELNKRCNKHDVSIAKILMSHDHSAFDMGLLFNWNLSFLPLMLAWLERADWLTKDGCALEVTGESIQVRQLSTIYEFAKELSMVVVGQQRKFLNSRKRKFDEKVM